MKDFEILDKLNRYSVIFSPSFKTNCVSERDLICPLSEIPGEPELLQNKFKCLYLKDYSFWGHFICPTLSAGYWPTMKVGKRPTHIFDRVGKCPTICFGGDTSFVRHLVLDIDRH